RQSLAARAGLLAELLRFDVPGAALVEGRRGAAGAAVLVPVVPGDLLLGVHPAVPVADSSRTPDRLYDDGAHLRGGATGQPVPAPRPAAHQAPAVEVCVMRVAARESSKGVPGIARPAGPSRCSERATHSVGPECPTNRCVHSESVMMRLTMAVWWSLGL